MARKVQQAGDDGPGAAKFTVSHLEIGNDFRTGRRREGTGFEFLDHRLDQAGGAAKGVVEFMGRAGYQLSNGRKALGSDKTLLCALLYLQRSLQRTGAADDP